MKTEDEIQDMMALCTEEQGKCIGRMKHSRYTAYKSALLWVVGRGNKSSSLTKMEDAYKKRLTSEAE